VSVHERKRGRAAIAVVASAVALAGCGGAADRPAQPSPTRSPDATPPPADPATELTALRGELLPAIGAWRRTGGPLPAAVARPARRQQVIYRRLTRHPKVARRTLRRLHGAAREDAADIIAAQRALRILNAPFRKAHLKLRIGRPEPADRLLAHYREARARSRVGVPLLAAVNLVESYFGRLRNDSVAGAQGPMQFIPATWARYGNGGDVHDPRDAILGAARFLHAAGAPARPRRALFAYNPSPLYVTAVTRYATVIRRDLRAFYAFYAWRPPVP
jgi:membrane-bound lytic murein transglycosylase B